MESSAKAAPVDTNTVAAAVEIATMRMCWLLPELFYATHCIAARQP
jgi:hypothetical protein